MTDGLKKAIYELFILGASLAATISYVTHESILWAIFHGNCTWFYVIYFAITR